MGEGAFSFALTIEQWLVIFGSYSGSLEHKPFQTSSYSLFELISCEIILIVTYQTLAACLLVVVCVEIESCQQQHSTGLCTISFWWIQIRWFLTGAVLSHYISVCLTLHSCAAAENSFNRQFFSIIIILQWLFRVCFTIVLSWEFSWRTLSSFLSQWVNEPGLLETSCSGELLYDTSYLLDWILLSVSSCVTSEEEWKKKVFQTDNILFGRIYFIGLVLNGENPLLLCCRSAI